MPQLSDFIDKLPEADRGEFASLISKAVVLSSREDASRAIFENPYLRAEKDAIVSHTTANYEKKFAEEKLPTLLDAEFKRRHPEKDAKDLEIEKLRSEWESEKKARHREQMLTKALDKIKADGLPFGADILGHFVGESEEATLKNLDALSGAILPWKEEILKKELTAKAAGPNPVAGGSNSFDLGKMTVTQQMEYARQSPEAKQAVMAHIKAQKGK